MACNRGLAYQMMLEAGPVVRDAHGAEHTRYRQLLRPFFGARGLARWLPVVRALAVELIDGIAREGRCDLVADFGKEARSLAFGGGPHGCLGAHLARMEMRVAIEEWHRRIPDYQITPGASTSAGWPAALVGLDSLPLVFPPGEN